LEVQVIAQLLVIVRTLSSYPVLLRQPRLVATGEFRGTASMAGFPGVGRLAMNVILLIKANKIK